LRGGALFTIRARKRRDVLDSYRQLPQFGASLCALASTTPWNLMRRANENGGDTPSSPHRLNFARLRSGTARQSLPLEHRPARRPKAISRSIASSHASNSDRRH
jgi:hypothetical protein